MVENDQASGWLATLPWSISIPEISTILQQSGIGLDRISWGELIMNMMLRPQLDYRLTMETRPKPTMARNSRPLINHISAQKTEGVAATKA